jgi:hypothetical protein
MSLPQSYALNLYRGDTFPFAARIWADTVGGTPADLTGTTPAAQLRDEQGSLILTMTCTVTMPNIVNITIPATAWPASTTDRARWDLQLTGPNGVRTVVAGPVQIVGDVTIP